jgi:hypothetical protein
LKMENEECQSQNPDFGTSIINYPFSIFLMHLALTY